MLLSTSAFKINLRRYSQALRRALLQRLAPGTVQWGRRLDRYVEHEHRPASPASSVMQSEHDEVATRLKSPPTSSTIC